MKTFKALLLREYWEHRGAFVKTPIIMGVVTAVLLILAYLFVENVDVKFSGGENLEYGVAHLNQIPGDDIRLITNHFLTGMEGLYHFILFIIIFFYLLGSLFDDRKDLSILFWKSLPVSDLNTVLSKLVAALIVAPLCFWVFLMASELLAMLLFSLFLLINGANPFTILWANTDLLGHWAAFGMGCLVQGLWALPIYGWLMLCSSWAKRRPFIWAVFVPTIIFLIRGWIAAFTLTAQSFSSVTEILKSLSIIAINSVAPYESHNQFIGDVDLSNHNLVVSGDIINSMWQSLQSGRIVFGMALAAAFLAAAIFIRRYRNTT